MNEQVMVTCRSCGHVNRLRKFKTFAVAHNEGNRVYGPGNIQHSFSAYPGRTCPNCQGVWVDDLTEDEDKLARSRFKTVYLQLHENGSGGSPFAVGVGACLANTIAYPSNAIRGILASVLTELTPRQVLNLFSDAVDFHGHGRPSAYDILRGNGTNDMDPRYERHPRHCEWLATSPINADGTRSFSEAHEDTLARNKKIVGLFKSFLKEHSAKVLKAPRKGKPWQRRRDRS